MPNPHLVGSEAAIEHLLERLQRVAILGIRTERDAAKPAHYVPAALQKMGLTLLPVAAVDLGVTEVLGAQVYTRVRDVPGPIDLVDVFRRPADLPAHLEDLLAARPRAVWFQSGIRNDAVALALAEAGIDVVQDRCLMVDYRHFKALQTKS